MIQTSKSNARGLALAADSKLRQKQANAQYSVMLRTMRDGVGNETAAPRVSKRKHRGEHNPTKPSIYFKQARRLQLRTGNFKAKYQKAQHIG